MSALPTDDFVRCQHCGVSLRKKNVGGHLLKVHPVRSNGIKIYREQPRPKSRVVACLPIPWPGERRECLASSFGTILVPPARTSSEVIPVLAAPGREICPRCGGDGGVRGGCRGGCAHPPRLLRAAQCIDSMRRPISPE